MVDKYLKPHLLSPLFRLSRESRTFSASRFSLRENLLFANRPSRRGMAARIGRESRDFERESEGRRDSVKLQAPSLLPAPLPKALQSPNY